MRGLILVVVLLVVILALGAWPPNRWFSQTERDHVIVVPGRFSMRCINLVRSTDRRHFIKQQVLGCGFIDNWEFVEGIDGRQLSSVERGTYVLSDSSLWSYTVTLSEAGAAAVDPGILGCTLSHVKAVTEFQTDYCLIIEDDAFLSLCHLHEDFDIDQIIQDAPADWGILQLGCNQHSIGEYRPWVSADRMYGAYAYIIKKVLCRHHSESLGTDRWNRAT